MSTRQTWAGSITAVVLGLLLPACAGRRPPESPQKPIPVLDATMDELLERVDRLAATGPWTMRGALKFENLARRTRRNVDVRIAGKKPNNLRIQGTKPLLPTIFMLVANADGIWLDVPTKRKTYTLATDATPDPKRVPPGLMAFQAPEFLRALCPDATTSRERWTLLTEPFAYVLLGLTQTDGVNRPTRELRFERYGLQLAAQRLFDSTGKLTTDARYGSHDAGSLLPRTIRIERPFDAIAITLELDESKTADLAETAFRFKPPDGRTIIDIAADDADLPEEIPGLETPDSTPDQPDRGSVH